MTIEAIIRAQDWLAQERHRLSCELVKAHNCINALEGAIACKDREILELRDKVRMLIQWVEVLEARERLKSPPPLSSERAPLERAFQLLAPLPNWFGRLTQTREGER